MKKIDIREIRLGKWYIPKRESIFDKENKCYPTIGYFDILEVVEVEQGEPDVHPWRLAYEQSHRRTEDLQSDYFVQEIKAFTNLSDGEGFGFKKNVIDTFWKKESILLCMSMLHPQEEISIDKILLRISKLFADTDYLYYFSFDYSGIIIFAKNLTVNDFLAKMFELNYNNSDSVKMIKDTFSIYGVEKKYLKEIHEENVKHQVDMYDNNFYEIAVNISILDYTKYRLFYEELEKYEKQYGYKSIKRCISGRHDVSIINQVGNLHWMLLIQCLLEQYTNSENSAFYAYETFIKTEEANIKFDDKVVDCTEEYLKIKEKITDLYNNFCNKVLGEEYHAYRTAIKEVCNSILSIMKNGLAEDFVLCMYQPFEEFLIYLIDKVEEEKKISDELVREKYIDEFDRCFADFFDALNSLINSAMHTDRQFIQSTSFSAIFYDIPPKIMAYYMAMIDKIHMLMRSQDNYKYTFFMKPAFSDEINVTKISYQSEKPESRILQVAINERCLYRPNAVIRRMAHEIAHYVGDGLRKREDRKRLLIRTYLYIMIRDCLHEDFEENNNFSDLVNNIYRMYEQIPEFQKDKDNYSEDCTKLPNRIYTNMKKNSGVSSILRDFFSKEIPLLLKEKKYSYLCELAGGDNLEHPFCVAGLKKGNFDAGEFSKLQEDFLIEQAVADTLEKMLDIEKNHKKNWNGTICESGILTYFGCILRLYSEVYADMQMILVLDYSYDAYLNAFIEDERVEPKEILESNEDISRIAVITKLMQDKKLWNEKMIANASPEVKEFHKIIQDFITEMESEHSVFYQQNKFLMEYLLSCYEESERHYKSIDKELQKMRENIHIVLEHEDICEVYSVIHDTVREYRNNIIR